MEYTKLGNTDLEVSKICIGCMSFGKAGTMHDWTLDEKESEKVIKHALDLGINFFDTANCYSAGTSEEYLGKAIRNNIARDKVVIASKVMDVYLRRQLQERLMEHCSGWERIISISILYIDSTLILRSKRRWKP